MIAVWEITTLSSVNSHARQFQGVEDKIELLPSETIQKQFESPPDRSQIHVVVEPLTISPISLITREVHCSATYLENTLTFPWTVTNEMVTLKNLKAKLRVYFQFPEGTEDNDIVVGHNIIHGQDPILLHEDAVLVSIVWTGQCRVKLPIIVDTSQQPFTKWNFQKIKRLYNLGADTFIDLPKFEGGISQIPSDDLEYMTRYLMKKYNLSSNIAGANEATRCVFISTIIYGLASSFNGNVKVYRQYEVSGSHGQGPIDWAVKIGVTIIPVIEAKQENFDQGVGQNVVQCQASLQSNRKRSYSEIRDEVMYGIVSTAVEWVIIKVVSNAGNVAVSLSSRSPSQLPLANPNLTHDLLREPLVDLCGQIRWIFEEQIRSPKRQCIMINKE